MNEKGGIKDDCIITRDDNARFFVVLNAGCKDKDLEHFRQQKKGDEDVNIEYNEDNSLIAVQGPKAAALLEDILGKKLDGMDFMTSQVLKHKGYDIRVSRCGYTGEDGFEISVPGSQIEGFVKDLESKKEQDGS